MAGRDSVTTKKRKIVRDSKGNPVKDSKGKNVTSNDFSKDKAPAKKSPAKKAPAKKAPAKKAPSKSAPAKKSSKKSSPAKKAPAKKSDTGGPRKRFNNGPRKGVAKLTADTKKTNAAMENSEKRAAGEGGPKTRPKRTPKKKALAREPAGGTGPRKRPNNKPSPMTAAKKRARADAKSRAAGGGGLLQKLFGKKK